MNLSTNKARDIMKKVDLIIDLQFGSTGKGLIAGYLAEKNQPDVVVTANMPNAGHTYVNAEGRTWVHKVLPNGIVSPKLKHVLIGAGAVFDPQRLADEVIASVDCLAGAEILVHENAGVLAPRHREKERAKLSGISSTMQGSGAALMEKMERNGDVPILARDTLCSSETPDVFMTAMQILEIGHIAEIPFRVVTHQEYMNVLYGAKHVLAEGAQGYSLSLNGRFWPYCTSRDCTPARFLADMGIPHKMLRKVIGTARCHPIRVGNTPDGYSGDAYSDQVELDWSDVGQKPETTTVTGRQRRIFSFSQEQIHEALSHCQPDEVFLNFCNYTEAYMDVVNTIEIANRCATDGNPLVKYLGFGPSKTDVRERF